MLTRDEIARRIPHQGEMCLLERVISWSDDRIHCEASSHRSEANPLRAHGRLGIACGVEYAAQAMAVHGALLAEAAAEGGKVTRPRAGYLAGLRGVQFHVRRLDDVEGLLSIRAERLLGNGNGMVYGFSLEGGGRALLQGRATVMLDAALAPPGTASAA